MIHLYMIRHGDCFGKGTYVGRKTDVSLTDPGKKQIEGLCVRLSEDGAKPYKLYTSPLKRALQSADIIGEAFNINSVSLASLEESDFGDWEGLSYDEILRRDPEKLKDWIDDPVNKKPPGGESLIEVQKRVREAAETWEELIADEKEYELLTVSHRGPLMLLLLHYLKLDPAHFWSFRLDRGSLTKINLYPHFTELEFLNYKT